MNAVLIVILRWLHIIPAAIVIGGLIFLRFVLPAAIRPLPDERGREVFLKARRIFKIMPSTLRLASWASEIPVP